MNGLDIAATIADMHQHALAKDLDKPALTLLAGITAVTGDEGQGKTHLLQQLADAYQVDVFWCDLKLPHQDKDTAQACWDAWQARYPSFDQALLQTLIDALSLREHTHKQLFMLSTGSRRKVAIAGALASGARVTLLDQPFVSLDAVSIQAVLDFLQDMSTHPTRAWVVADYTVPEGVDLALLVQL
jgi:energy-coupling factor transporter ATP-binding protein EcfA2